MIVPKSLFIDPFLHALLNPSVFLFVANHFNTTMLRFFYLFSPLILTTISILVLLQSSYYRWETGLNRDSNLPVVMQQADVSLSRPMTYCTACILSSLFSLLLNLVNFFKPLFYLERRYLLTWLREMSQRWMPYLSHSKEHFK